MEEKNLSNKNYDYGEGIIVDGKFPEGTYTNEEIKNLNNTWETAEDRFRNAFSIEYTSADGFLKDAAGLLVDTSAAGDAYKNALAATAGLGAAVSNFAAWEDNGEQLLQVADAASAAALRYLNQKFDYIMGLLTNMETITVGAILGEAAPFAKNPSAAWAALKKKFRKMIDDLSFSDLLDDLGQDALSSILSDENLINSIANVNAVQGIIASADSINKLWSTASNILKTVEPLMTPIEIITLWCASALNPASSTEAATKTTNYGQQLLDWAMAQATKLLKKYIYSIKLSVPSLLVTSMQSLSVKSSVKEWGWGTEGSFMRQVAAAGTNSGSSTYDSSWTYTAAAREWVDNSKWNTNNWNSSQLLSKIGLDNEDYNRIISRSMSRIVETSKDSLRIDQIASDAYKKYSEGRISFLGSFNYSWDESRDPAGAHPLDNYNDSNWLNGSMRETSNFFSKPDKKLIIKADTKSNGLHFIKVAK